MELEAGKKLKETEGRAKRRLTMIKNTLAYVTRKRFRNLIILLVITAMATLRARLVYAIKDATNRAAAKTLET